MAPPPPSSFSPPPVQTTYGPVVGFSNTSSSSSTPSTKHLAPVNTYLSIPYATAPRFTRPVAPPPWKTPLPCLNFGPKFPQAPNLFWDLIHERSKTGRPSSTHPQSESAHTVNVWTPANPPPRAGEKLPVLVWIYGGGLENGSSEEPVYDGASFVRSREAAGQRVLLVSGNYRTNVFGFGNGPGWAALDRKGISGNYGLYDVLAIFRWVQANVEAFGGDAANVTAFGESAGAFLLTVLMTVQERCFDRAILHSGAPLTMPFRLPAESYRPYGQLVKAFCPNATIDAGRFAAVKAAPWEKVLAAHVEAKGVNKVAISLETGPHATFTQTTQTRLEKGELSPWVKSVIVGTLPDEGVPFSFLNPGCFQAKGVEALLKRYPESDRKEAMRLFPDDPEGERRKDYTTAPVSRWIAEHTFEVPAEMVAEAIVTTGKRKRSERCPLYMFRYATPIEGMKWGSGKSKYGVPHGMELAATFGIEELVGKKDTPGGKAAEQMMARWAEYARSGKPGDGWDEWHIGAGGWQEGRGLGPQDSPIKNERWKRQGTSEGNWKDGRGIGPSTNQNPGNKVQGQERQWLVFKSDGQVEMQAMPAIGEAQRLVRKLLVDKEVALVDKWKSEMSIAKTKASKL